MQRAFRLIDSSEGWNQPSFSPDTFFWSFLDSCDRWGLGLTDSRGSLQGWLVSGTECFYLMKTLASRRQKDSVVLLVIVDVFCMDLVKLYELVIPFLVMSGFWGFAAMVRQAGLVGCLMVSFLKLSL
ncbi:hypothetical protein GOP47_0026304 [Adiantum capillus-veneris]|nr:hypothetical protein GOP47_0026304 [Adiantum capillus-veneris]